jgi:DNA-binding transcriptional regulator YdaS (Cro superfamily)
MTEHDPTRIRAVVETLSGGDIPKAARALDVDRALVWQWVNGKRPVAAKHCLRIERETNGIHTRYDVRPDVFGTTNDS